MMQAHHGWSACHDHILGAHRRGRARLGIGAGDAMGCEVGGELVGSGVRPAVGDGFVHFGADGAEPCADRLDEPDCGVGLLAVGRPNRGRAAAVGHGDAPV